MAALSLLLSAPSLIVPPLFVHPALAPLGTSRDVRMAPPRCALFKPVPVTEGSEWDGLVSKITDYGCFVTFGHEQHSGLIHVSSLTDERLAPADVPALVESKVGTEGSSVRVKVAATTFKGKKRTSLTFLHGITKENMEDVVFAGRLRDAEA